MPKISAAPSTHDGENKDEGVSLGRFSDGRSGDATPKKMVPMIRGDRRLRKRKNALFGGPGSL